MAGNIVNITAGASAAAGPFNLAIPATGAGNSLIVLGVNFAGGSRVISSNAAGAWTSIADNASFICVWKCLNPATGTTQISIAATGNGYSLLVIEVSGLNPTGATVVSTFGGGATAAWTTPTISPAASSMSFAFAYQGDDNTTTSTIPGFTLSSGTGVVNGAAADGSNFNMRMSGTKDISAGAGQSAAGLWSLARTWVSIYVALELSSAVPGGVVVNNDRLGIKLGIGI